LGITPGSLTVEPSADETGCWANGGVPVNPLGCADEESECTPDLLVPSLRRGERAR
jgi:hypothetical protein